MNIYALSSGRGQSGIAIVRISGKGASQVCKNLTKLKVIISLGKIAFDNCIKFYKKNFIIKKKFIFKHGAKYNLPDGKILIACYHPSPRNVNTKIIDVQKMIKLLKLAKKIL